MCITVLGVRVCFSVAEKMDLAKRKVDRFSAEDWFEEARQAADRLQVTNHR